MTVNRDSYGFQWIDEMIETGLEWWLFMRANDRTTLLDRERFLEVGGHEWRVTITAERCDDDE